MSILTRPFPALVARPALTLGLGVAVGIALLTLSAKLQVPFWPVPMTLQTAVAILLPLLFGPAAGVGAVAAYLAAGAAGLPIFAGPMAGPAYFLGPTGGYLIGFLAGAAAVAAVIARPSARPVLQAWGALALGLVVLYACGLAWLSMLIGPAAAIAAGLVPFLAAEAVKFTLACALAVVLVRPARG